MAFARGNREHPCLLMRLDESDAPTLSSAAGDEFITAIGKDPTRKTSRSIRCPVRCRIVGARTLAVSQCLQRAYLLRQNTAS